MTRLDDIKAREAAATGGPWGADIEDDTDDYPGAPTRRYPIGLDGPWNDGQGVSEIIELTVADATFIANAREDIPWLVERVDAVLALHAEDVGTQFDTSSRAVPWLHCAACRADYPCPTVRAIEGVSRG